MALLSYADIPIIASFDKLVDGAAYVSLPDDWAIMVCDVVDSTGAIEAGLYKAVNMIGAASISAQHNALGHGQFPFIFGGDGSACAHPPEDTPVAMKALAEVRQWSMAEFGLELRACAVSVADIRKGGSDVRVARYKLQTGAEYAMFSGGGIAHADELMKQGHPQVPDEDIDTFPNLTGLSCRWTPAQSQQGTILSLVMGAQDDADLNAFNGVINALLGITQALDRNGNPFSADGPDAHWPPAGLDLEAHASHGRQSFAKRKRQLLMETLVAWVFIKTGIKLGSFDPGHYARTVSGNADFQKFDDGLKMTIDCPESMAAEIEALLYQAHADGHIYFGTHRQSHAVMTCFVPSITDDDHLHFVDGSDGGYTLAATAMKRQMASYSYKM